MNATYVFLGLCMGLVGLGLVLRRRDADLEEVADAEVADADLEEVADVADADLEEVADADLEEVAVRAPPMPSAASIMALRHRLACTRRNRFTIDAQVSSDADSSDELDPEICSRCLQVNPDRLYVAGDPIQVLGCNACMRDPARRPQPAQEARRG